jgi:hypothetical protein
MSDGQLRMLFRRHLPKVTWSTSGPQDHPAASPPPRSAESLGMPARTRRRDRDRREECWLIYYGDVRVGFIAIRSGIPNNQAPWGWRCGFYPGSEPGEYTSGTATTFDQARADFEKAWQS